MDRTPVSDDKQWRKDLDTILQDLRTRSRTTNPNFASRASRERSIAITKVEEAIMWLGMDLKAIGETPNPYPNSYNPDSPVIDPTADGLKL